MAERRNCREAVLVAEEEGKTQKHEAVYSGIGGLEYHGIDGMLY